MSQVEQLPDETSGITDSHWQLIAESIPHIVWIATPDGRVEYINQLGTDYTGWAPGVTYDRYWLEVVHPDDVQGADLAWRSASQRGTEYIAEYRIRRADGEYRWHVSQCRPQRDAGEEIVKWIGTATDTHDRKTGEARLREAHRTTEEALTLLATLQAEAPVGFGFVDRDLCLVRLNQELASVIGVTTEDLLGRPVPSEVPALWEQLDPVYRHVLESGEAVRNLPTADRRSATDPREMLASYYPVRVGTEIIGIGLVVVDVTDRLELETALHGLTRAEEFRSAATGQPDAGLAVVFRDVSSSGRSANVIRVVIADVDKAAAGSFRALLDHHESIEVVAVSSTSASAVGAAQRLNPRRCSRQLGPSRCRRVTATRRIKAGTPLTNVILMTDRYDDDVALASIEAGCAGVLDKRRAWVELVSAVRAAYHGETTLSQTELQRVVSKVRGGGHPGRATDLTEREEEVLACMRNGLSNAQVAERLAVTPNTVRNHVQRILFKLNVHSKP